MKKVGLVGWRGMVGSVLIERMKAEGDFKTFHPVYFSTSQASEAGPDGLPLKDANKLSDLQEMDMILTCQGGDWTKEIHPKLRGAGWKGHWIDAASALRMEKNAVIILDPVNQAVIDRARESGVKDWIGGNCTVSLMLLGVGGLFKKGWVEWASSHTYQAASGAGAKNMIELLKQMQFLGDNLRNDMNAGVGALELEKSVSQMLIGEKFPKEAFGFPLAANVLPWIDSALPSGQSREEWKAQAEANKILGTSKEIPIDGTCVRVGALRCHSQALTIKLNKNISLKEIEETIKSDNQWVRFVENDKEKTLNALTPASVSGKLDIAVGRVRKMSLGDEFLNVFTCGDQLLWGAAEPLRRMLRQLV
ncbi:MAG: aspartate-semialdehyde dehydrogenase [Bacteriovoracaceae bacterium]|nr:aspartate-semialdehyde dehydrogenase [Bacteriovoracaceae bacterium]